MFVTRGLILCRLLCAFRGKYFSEEVHHQYHADEESAAFVSGNEETQDTATSLVQNESVSENGENDLPNLAVGESSSIDEECTSSSVSTVSSACGDGKLSAPGVDLREEEDGAGGTEDRDGDGECPLTDVSSSLLSTRAVFNLDNSILPSTMPAGNFGRCFIEVCAMSF